MNSSADRGDGHAGGSRTRAQWIVDAFGIGDAARMEMFVANMKRWRNSLGGATLANLTVAWAFSEFAPPRPVWIWAALGTTAYGAEALQCLWIERHGRWSSIPPWWIASTAFLSFCVGLLWGSLAWWLPGELSSLQILGAFGSGMVLLGAASASNSTGLLWVVVLPGVLLVPAAMVWHAGLPLAGALSLALLLLVLRHGLANQRTLTQAIEQRREVEALSAKLQAQQVRLIETERARTLLEERQRLLRDLHDGIGSSLISALKVIDQGGLEAAAVGRMLHECLDDLRLTVDSLEPFDHDLATLMATLRYRLGERLERAGVGVEWHVADVPALSWLHAPQALDVLRIVQEALTNVLKHAGATVVRVSVDTVQLPGGDPTARIRIEDDGAGFDARSTSNGRGLHHMRHRARQLAADIEIGCAESGGTQVCLTLPVSLPVSLPAA